MQMLVRIALVNVFSGTDPNETVVGKLNEESELSPANAKSRRKTILKAQSSMHLKVPQKVNGYEAVAEHLPPATDIESDFLGIATRYQILSDMTFNDTLEKVKMKDAAVMQQFGVSITEGSYATSQYISKQSGGSNKEVHEESKSRRVSKLS